MPARSHGRKCLIAALCIIILILLLKIAHIDLHSDQLGKGINNSTLGFEAILPINAPWRTDRKDSLTLTAAHTGIALEWIDGVNASQIDERAYPQGNHRSIPKGNLGSWRAHMDALRLVIERNLSTALILEDDVDWDSRVRSQLAAFGRASQRLPNMIRSANSAYQEQVPSSDTAAPQASPDPPDSTEHFTLPLPCNPISPHSLPYGNDWDILWLGHCSMSLPPSRPTSTFSSAHTPDRFILHDDPTISSPPTNHLPLQARIYHRSHSALCTLAYAVTQRGARKILYEHGIRNLDKGYDFALSEWCDSRTKDMGERPMCLTSSPSLFGHFWGTGGGRGDIVGVGMGGVEGGLVGGVRGSLGHLVEGD